MKLMPPCLLSLFLLGAPSIARAEVAAQSPAAAETASRWGETVTAHVHDGALRGARQGTVSRFLGIPFAQPPIGDRRWRPPAPPAAWTGERDATHFAASCPQTDAPPSLGPINEDCLYLNVWTSAQGAAKPGSGLPVMVWIHGGGWRGGSAADPSFDGTQFARAGIVLVTVNYRLGPLGVFAHPALAGERAAGFGNYGLMDNIAALEWVSRNIAAFGGSAHRVTIFGESAGAGQVLSLLTIPRVRSLFQQAIVQSGPAFMLPVTVAGQETSDVTLVKHLGLPATATARDLRALPADRLIQGEAQVAPFLDGMLLTRPPLEAFETGTAAPVPLIIGTNADEGSLVDSYPQGAAMTMMLYRDQMDELRRLYPHESATPAALTRVVFADTVFGAPARLIAKRAGALAPAYLYRFNYVLHALRAGGATAIHGSEIPFVFDTLRPADPIAADDRAMAELMHGCWIGFAKTGRPVCPGGVSWAAAGPEAAVSLSFDRNATAHAVTDFDKARDDFIESHILRGGETKLLERLHKH